MDNPQITYIRFVFQGSDLFEGREDANRYEQDLSAQRYADLCQEELRRVYPGVEVEIIDTETDNKFNKLPSQVLGLVDKVGDNPRELEVLDELQRIEDICNQEVYKKDKWLVQRRWVTIIDTGIRERFPTLPTSVIEWACREEMIEEAEYNDGYWEFPWDRLIDWTNSAPVDDVFSSCSGILGVCIAEDEVRTDFQCYSDDIFQFHVADLPLEIEALFIAPEWFEHSLFQAENSSVILMIYGKGVSVDITHFYDGVQWNYPWAYGVYAQVIGECTKDREVKVEAQVYDAGFHLGFRWPFTKVDILREVVHQTSRLLRQLIRETEEKLSGKLVWKSLYERDEGAFCMEILQPLLKKMGFETVRYTHGKDEYGKDFVFCERTKFDEDRYCALQAKAGGISGGVNSQIGEIFEQIEMGFEHPFRCLQEERYMSEFIVAISGSFTSNAKDRILSKLRKLNNIGSVYFWDKDKILYLIDKFYSDEV
jgi:hypothetical protein